MSLIKPYPFPVCPSPLQRSRIGEDLPTRSASTCSGPGEGNLEENCKQVDLKLCANLQKDTSVFALRLLILITLVETQKILKNPKINIILREPERACACVRAPV